MGQHALLSASSAAHWMACTRAPRWEETLPEPEEKEYAREGTLAHAICERKLNNLLRDKKRSYNLAKLKKDPLYSPGMDSYTDVYVDYIEELLGLDGRKQLFVEQRVEFSDWVPEGFGTSDAIILDDEVLHVIDFKYGKGVPVSAVGNPQLRLYGLGAFRVLQRLSDIETVHMVIIQPRLPAVITEDTMSIDDLLDWAEKEVKPKAALAWAGEGEWNPGVKQCQFCRGRYRCVRRAYWMLQTGSILEQSERNELTNVEIAGILEKADQLARWATGLKEDALARALEGEKFPGYKLVTSRTNRRIRDPEKAAALLTKQGCTPEMIYNLKGITDLDKAVGKKRLAEILGDELTMTEGKPTLVVESDPREALDLRPKDNEYFDE